MFFVTSGHLLSRCTFDHTDFLTTMTHTYTGSSPVSLEQFLRATERLSPELQSLVRPWIKHNSHLLCCAFFFRLTTPFKRCSNILKPTFEGSDDAALTNLFPSNRTPLPHLLPLITTQGQYFQSHTLHSFSYLLNIFSAPSCPEETVLTPMHSIPKPLKCGYQISLHSFFSLCWNSDVLNYYYNFPPKFSICLQW